MSATISLVAELIALAEQMAAAYQKLHAIAQQVGVTDEQLAEADKRFATRVVDPLASQPEGLPPALPPVESDDYTTARFASLGLALAARDARRDLHPNAPDTLVLLYPHNNYGLFPVGVGPYVGPQAGAIVAWPTA